MRDKKRIIAKEILILFSGLILVGLIWLFLIGRNTYYSHQINSRQSKIASLEKQLDSIPGDYIDELYKKTSKYFIVGYKVGEKSFMIVREQEQKFLKNHAGESITKYPENPVGYVLFEISDGRDGNIAKDEAVFDFVSIQTFREKIKDTDYQNYFYETFSAHNISDNNKNDRNEEPDTEFSTEEPYNEFFDFGTKEQFKECVTLASEIKSVKNAGRLKIESEIQQLRNSILDTEDSLENNNPIPVLSFVAIAIAIILYPIRLSIALIIWALKILMKT